MATAIFTEVVPRVDQQLTNAIYKDQIQDNLNALGGAHKSLLTNGGFEIWQRGAGAFVFTSLNSGYTADRWLAQSNSGCTSTVTQETSVVDTDSGASLKYVTSGGTAILAQKIETYGAMRGRTLSLSMRVRQSAASAVTIYIEQTSGTTVSATSATTGSFVTFTVTAVIASNTSIVQVAVTIASGATVYLDQAMLVIGPAPAPYQPLHPQEDLARCQRYYEVHGGVNTSMSFAGYNAAAAVCAWYVPFAVTKGGTPTMTKNGTWSVTNCGQPSTNSPHVNGYTYQATVTALGAMGFFANSTDDTIEATWNP